VKISITFFTPGTHVRPDRVRPIDRVRWWDLPSRYRAMALESIEALAVWTRLSESHCHPPREMRRSGSGRAEYRRAVAHRRKGVWMASFQVGGVALKGWCLHDVVLPVSNNQEHHDSWAQARWRLTTPTARMARIGMGQRRHPQDPVCGCTLSTCDPSQKSP
jgi:hypothetical protein